MYVTQTYFVNIHSVCCVCKTRLVASPVAGSAPRVGSVRVSTRGSRLARFAVPALVALHELILVAKSIARAHVVEGLELTKGVSASHPHGHEWFGTLLIADGRGTIRAKRRVGTARRLDGSVTSVLE
jgi:hypothetical protein